MILNDTIIAPATAVGGGGIAVVRVSGPRALECLQLFFRPTRKPGKYRSHQLYHGHLVDRQGDHLDEVLAVFMAAPNTYTRQDVVEFHCHGSQQIVKSILTLFLEEGLRLASPGEFTYRAFINGRLDLSQAEAVAHLIHAKSDSSRKLALSQVEGQLSKFIFGITEKLRGIQVLFEAWMDFPEEDLPADNLSEIGRDVCGIISKIDQITDTYRCGRVLLEGASILLVGRPNAGKSSLLNRLLGEERAIVTDVPGTTRDLLEEGMTIGGLPVRLIDTAGLRQSDDPVEAEGVRRAKKKIDQADLVLLLVDGSKPVDEQDLFAYHACSKNKGFLVKTKSDLPMVADTSFCEFPGIGVSSKTGAGLELLQQEIAQILLAGHFPSAESVMLAEQRHFDAIIACRNNLCLLTSGLKEGLFLEFLAFEVREALHHLGQISGQTTTDSVLEKIFSKFCIGK